MIDVKTALFLLGLGNLAFTACLFFMRKQSDIKIPWGLWITAKGLQGAAWLLLWMRGVIPDLFTVLFANWMVLSGSAFEMAAIWEFFGMKVSKRMFAFLAVLVLTPILIYYRFDAGPNARVTTASLISGTLILLASFAYLRHWGRISGLQRFVGICILAVSMGMFFRGASAFMDLREFGLMSANRVQSFTFVILYLFMILSGFGFLLILKERTDEVLLRLATIDHLTGTLNRRSFLERGLQALALARRAGHPVALLMMDIDFFKKINDSHGHPVGDEVLRAMTGICRNGIRNSDLLGRLGGEEFSIILQATDLKGGMATADRIRAEIEDASIVVMGAHVRFTVSVGVTVSDPDDNLDAMVRKADQALYSAKNSGRNRVAAYETEGAGHQPMAV